MDCFEALVKNYHLGFVSILCSHADYDLKIRLNDALALISILYSRMDYIHVPLVLQSSSPGFNLMQSHGLFPILFYLWQRLYFNLIQSRRLLCGIQNLILRLHVSYNLMRSYRLRYKIKGESVPMPRFQSYAVTQTASSRRIPVRTFQSYVAYMGCFLIIPMAQATLSRFNLAQLCGLRRIICFLLILRSPHRLNLMFIVVNRFTYLF